MGQPSNAFSAPVIVDLIAFLSILLFALPCFYSIARRVYYGKSYQNARPTSEAFEDEDGVATEEARSSFSAAIPKYAALVSTLFGLVVNIITNVYSEVRSDLPSRWVHGFVFGGWVVLFIQVLHIVAEHDTIKRFDFGIMAGATSVALCTAFAVGIGQHLQNISDFRKFHVLVILYTIQLVAGVVSFLSCYSIPRRPSISHGNHPVDGQYTVSALGRYTFAWAEQTLGMARKDTLELSAIPRLHLRIRSAFLEYHIKEFGSDGNHLLKTLLFAHGTTLAFQTIFALGTSVVQFAPQLVMFALLKLLEQKADTLEFTIAAWALVLALGLAMLAAAWAEVWTHWIVDSRLGLPVRTELAAMIFSKATRRKNVKGARTQDEPSPGSLSFDISGDRYGAPQPEGDSSDPAHDDEHQSRQGTINLIGVDAPRIADFATYSFIFPWTIAEIVISIFFLVQLIGWWSLLSGFSIFIIVLPLNILASKHYADAQNSLMTIRDKKLMVVTEALQGIRQIKFSAQEKQWQNKIGTTRQQELATQWKVFCLNTCLIAIWILGPVMLSAVSLAVYAYLHGNLSASVAFTSISLFGSLEMTLAVVPELVSDALEAFVSVNRINEYLGAPEKEKSTFSKDTILFQKASIAWPSDSDDVEEDRFILRDIDLEIPAKQLTVVSGATGAGKSLFLAAIIGEVDQLAGMITCPEPPHAEDRYDHKATETNWIIGSAIAFVAQIPWIENATIKENILSGLPLDTRRYEKVLTYCTLMKDLQVLPDADETDIGANGINLSGGQRWRVSFARALYSRAGILVLDDIFSAVDAHVGRQLFEEALTGELGRGRTRILVTHHVGLCFPKASYSIVLGDGKVQYAGLPDADSITPESSKVYKGMAGDQEQHSFDHNADDEDHELLRQISSHASHKTNPTANVKVDMQGNTPPKKFTEEETHETGSVKLAIYQEYLTSSGGTWFWIPVIGLFIIYEGIVLGRSWLISLWTESYHEDSSLISAQYRRSTIAIFTKTGTVEESMTDTNLTFYLSIYMGLSLLICVLGTLRYFCVYWASIQAARRLFESITYTVLRAPLRWLDTTPVGRILNRMTADFDLIDSSLGDDIGFFLYQIIQLIGIIVASLVVSPWMLLSALVLLFLCARITSFYLSGARQVKRLESNAKSPVFEQFGSALAGIGTIRAYGKTEVYIDRMFGKIDDETRASWHILLFNRWLVWRLDLVGAAFAVFVTAVIVHYRMEASLAGFALSFALHYSSALIWSAKQYADVELAMNAVERVSEFAKLPTEDQSDGKAVSAAWPAEGRLEVNDLFVGYAPDLPPVLKGLTFTVEKTQRVGVVGRTGAGKSSLTLALFRFLEPRSGSIYIDGIDISAIALSTLRSRLAIIPQDPVLFSGTVRSNLDPFDNHSDEELYEALERVQLTHSHSSTRNVSRDEPPALAELPVSNTNKNIFTSLRSRISEGGLNLSQGQRQLLCLARAIVSRPKLMILDEATSAVDMATDALIQRSIREEFQDATLIVIAHRLSTIADFDRVLVMEEGRGVEYDTPSNLMQMADGIFKNMVERSGEVDLLKDLIVGDIKA